MRWVKATAKGAGAIPRETPLALYGEGDATAGDVDAIDGALRAIAEAKGAVVADRLAAGAALLSRARTAHDGGRGARTALKELDVAVLASEGRAGARP